MGLLVDTFDTVIDKIPLAAMPCPTAQDMFGLLIETGRRTMVFFDMFVICPDTAINISRSATYRYLFHTVAPTCNGL